MGSEGKSWFQVGFYSCGWVFIVTGGFSCFFMAPGLVFMIPGGFLLSLMVPGWFKSELSAAGAK